MGEKREHAGWKLQVGGRVRSDTRWPDFTPGVCAARVKSLTSCASQRYREPSLPGPNMRTPEVNNIQCRGNAESASWVLAMMLLLLKENPRQSPAGPIGLAALRYQGRLSLHFSSPCVHLDIFRQSSQIDLELASDTQEIPMPYPE